MQKSPHNHSALSFAQGTLIACEDGEMAIENIQAGDIVNTLSDGPQVVRWAGAGPATTRACIRIEAGALTPNAPMQPLLVAPSHRLILSNWRAELLFNSHRVMIEAKALVNGKNITRVYPETPLVFHHILFDTHEIISANSTPCESFLPTEFALNSLPEETRKNINSQFATSPTPLALPTITAAEAALLN